jgi:sugar lactone lactonase YvrE
LHIDTETIVYSDGTKNRSGQGVAYITDSSLEGRTGIIIVDLGTGESWRHLELHPSTLPEDGLVASYNGEAFLPVYPTNGVVDQWRYGIDGVTLSPDGQWLYYSALASRTWYKIATSLLLVSPMGPNGNSFAAWQARRGVISLGRLASHADGFESDARGNVYLSAAEQNAIYVWNPEEMMMKLFVRDGKIQWPDGLAISTDKKLYFTVTQAWL